MKTFQYEAYQLSDRRQAVGMIEALNERNARELLRDQDLMTTRLTVLSPKEPVGLRSLLYSAFQRLRPVTDAQRKEVVQQLLFLLQAGFTLSEAMVYLQNQPQLKNSRFGPALHAMHQAVLTGYTFSQVIKEHPTLFDTLMVTIIEAAEQSQSFTGTLNQLIVFLEERQQVNRQLGWVLVAVLLFMVLLTSLTALCFSAGGGVSVPTNTQNLPMLEQSIPGEVLSHLMGTVSVLGLILVTSLLMVTSDTIKALADYYALCLPGIRPLLVTLANRQWLSVFTVLMDNGVPTLKGLQLAFASIPNRYIQQSYLPVLTELSQGQRLSVALSKTDCLPDVAVTLLATAETQGQLRAALLQLVVMVKADSSKQLATLKTTMQLVLISVVLLVAVFYF